MPRFFLVAFAVVFLNALARGQPSASAVSVAGRNRDEGSFEVFTKAPDVPGEYPVVIWFNGFQSRYAWYETLLNKVVENGYITVSYQVPGMMDVATELSTRVDPLLSFIASGALDDALPADVRANATAIFTAGHSRGGKVASLAYSSNEGVTNAVLVDPVDSSMFAPVSEENPSAVESLRASGKTISVVGAGVEGSCNPSEGNYERFFEAAAGGSWELVIKGAGHAQFLDAGGLLNRVQDGLCGAGDRNRDDVADLVAADIVAWFSGNEATKVAFMDDVDQDEGVKFLVSRSLM